MVQNRRLAAVATGDEHAIFVDARTDAEAMGTVAAADTMRVGVGATERRFGAFSRGEKRVDVFASPPAVQATSHTR